MTGSEHIDDPAGLHVSQAEEHVATQRALCRGVGAYVFKVAFAMLLPGLPPTLAASPPAQALLQQYKCNLCHADREIKTGPAYVDLAVRYRRAPGAVASLVAAIKRGHPGSPGWHMPPHPEISDNDGRAMARYILSLKE